MANLFLPGKNEVTLAKALRLGLEIGGESRIVRRPF
jgi:hypothetical protein